MNNKIFKEQDIPIDYILASVEQVNSNSSKLNVGERQEGSATIVHHNKRQSMNQSYKSQQ